MDTNKDYSALIDCLRDETENLAIEVEDTKDFTWHILSFFDKSENALDERELRYIYNTVAMLLRVNIDRIESHHKGLAEIVTKLWAD